MLNRSYKGKSVTTHNESDLDLVLETKRRMGEKPVIVTLFLINPTVMEEFETSADAILVHFYDFAFGMNWKGVIEDERARKYRKSRQ